MSKGAKLSLLLLSLTVLLMAALMSGLIKSDNWKIKNIDIKAEFKRVSSEQIRMAVLSYPQRSFFKVKAIAIREKLINLPWVQKVTVNKKWPDTIVVKLVEHKAVAIWNEDKLLNDKGEIFKVDDFANLEVLPKLSGKDSQSVQIWDKYLRFNKIVQGFGYDLAASKVSERGGWELFLSNGIEINLGSQNMDARLIRLAETWSKLLRKIKTEPHYVDLRYTNGYAIKWQKPEINEQDTLEESETGNLNG